MPDKAKRLAVAQTLLGVAHEITQADDDSVGLLKLFIDPTGDGPECRPEAIDAWSAEFDSLEILAKAADFLEVRRTGAAPDWFGFALVCSGAVWGVTADGAVYAFINRKKPCPPGLLPGLSEVPEDGREMDEEAKGAVVEAITKGPVVVLLNRMVKAVITA